MIKLKNPFSGSEWHFLTIIGVIALIGGGVFWGTILAGYGQDTYGGVIVANTEEEYSQFKQELADTPILAINELDTLSSSPPIIVNFSIEVPYGYQFPYGKISPFDNSLHYSWVAFIIGATLIGVSSIRRKEEVK